MSDPQLSGKRHKHGRRTDLPQSMLGLEPKASPRFAPSSAPSGQANGIAPAHELIDRSQTVRAGLQDYRVEMTTGGLDACCQVLRQIIGNEKALLVTTPTVSTLYGEDLFARLREENDAVQIMSLNCTEASKTVDQVIAVCKEAAHFGISRRGLLVGIGGGVCTDITTVAASWIRRGVGYVRVPTTLIGQIDAGIGIKGAVNFHDKKSYLGCFYPPRAVVITPALLSTLPSFHVREGFAEMIKIAVVRDASLFQLVESSGRSLLDNASQRSNPQGRELLWKSITGMLAELEPNIFEKHSYERLVDFGHTFSPALESASGFTITHGEAVSIDMAVSVAVALKMDLLQEHVGNRILNTLMDLELPIWTGELSVDLCVRALQDCALHRGGQPNLVVPTDIGKATFLVDESAILSHLAGALDWLSARHTAAGGAPLPRCEHPKLGYVLAD